MSNSCPTVKVQTPKTPENNTGYVVINETDLTSDHTLFSEDEPTAAVPVEPKAAPALNTGTPPPAPWAK